MPAFWIQEQPVRVDGGGEKLPQGEKETEKLEYMYILFSSIQLATMCVIVKHH